MGRVRGKNIKPERVVRRMLHALGYRYRLHRQDLPGNPDLVSGPRKKVIFVHGCFWHQHSDLKCLDGCAPKSNTSYWGPKLRRNAERDQQHIAALRSAGWDVFVVWECDTKSREVLEARLTNFLDGREPRSISRSALLNVGSIEPGPGRRGW